MLLVLWPDAVNQTYLENKTKELPPSCQTLLYYLTMVSLKFKFPKKTMINSLLENLGWQHKTNGQM